jgi:hypothetical protein
MTRYLICLKYQRSHYHYKIGDRIYSVKHSKKELTPNNLMLYDCIALLNSSSARKSSSPDTIIFASPSIAVDKTGKSLGSRQ